MHENHQAEQYFFDGPTLARLATFVRGFERPVLLCTPMVGRFLWEQRHQVTVLDTDERFANLPGFQKWNIHRPTALDFKPDLILCDPPFFKVKLDRLYKAITTLTQGDVTVPLAIGWLGRRESALLGTFARYGLRPTGYMPSYVSVSPRTGIQFYATEGVTP